MFLPFVVIGGGSVAGYTMYCAGQAVGSAIFVPQRRRKSEMPPPTGTGLLLGSASGAASYLTQARVLKNNPSYAQWMRYPTPTNINKWKFQDFIKASGPFVASRGVIALLSVSVVGCVRVAVDSTFDTMQK
jgi:hypothetical protein